MVLLCLAMVGIGLSKSLLFSQAVDRPLDFEHLSVEQGLSQSTVVYIMEDRWGYLWFCTEDGLNKYDGYSFTHYKPDPDNPYSSLSHNNVRMVVEDKSGILWVGTLGGGLNRFEPATETFQHFQNSPQSPHSLSNNQILCLLADEQTGKLWIGTYGDGMELFNPEDGTFTHFRSLPGDVHTLSHNSVRVIHRSQTGILWIGTLGGGLNKFDPATGRVTQYKNIPGDPGTIADNQVLTLYEDAQGILWIGTYGKGMDRFDPQKETFTHFYTDPGDDSSISNNIVSAINPIGDGYYWIGTAGGLNLFSPVTGRFRRYFSDPADSHSLSNNEIRTIFHDRSGVLWIGTVYGGLNKFYTGKQRFKLFRHSPDLPDGLSSNRVMSIYKDKKNNIWVGTYDGLNRMNQAKGTFDHYRVDMGSPAGSGINQVLTICEDQARVLWIGTLGGLYRFDREAEKFSPHVIDPDDTRTFNNRITAILEDREGYLWVGAVGVLNQLDRNRKLEHRYRPDPQEPGSISHGVVIPIFEDREGALWFGTFKGLNRFNRKKQNFTVFFADPAQPGSLTNDKINYIFEDRHGQLWIGTDGGLHQFNRRHETFTCLRMKDGLPSDVIYGILEDDNGFLWISTNSGISRFHLSSRSFQNYDFQDGLQGNEFHYGACLRSIDGHMYFGGPNGLNAFFPENVKVNSYIPPVVLTNFRIFNKPVPIGEKVDGVVVMDRHISASQGLTLSYSHSAFSFEYAALHYAIPERNRYAYKMEGLEKEWNQVGNRRFASYAHLSPGKYVFRVKGCNSDGVWNEEGTSVPITINPPPWRTWWAYTLYFFAAGGIAWGYIRSQKKKLAYERSVNERLRQVDRLKDEFLANTSHELRTPLNGIIGIAESLIKGATGQLPQKTLQNLQMVALSGKRLSNLVNDILDYSKLKEKELRLRRRPVDMKSLTDVVLLFSRPLTDGKTLELKNEISSDIPFVFGDEDRLEQVMHNLVGNAVKFTESGWVKIDAEHRNAEVIIRVTDTGIGIPVEMHERIFQSFEQVDASASREYGGTGLGLSIARQLVELHGGMIGVESFPGKGSKFWFSLPVYQEDVTKITSSVGLYRSSDIYNVNSEPMVAASGLALSPVQGENTSASIERKGTGYGVLAVDDETVNLQVLVNHLSLNEFRVLKAHNGPEALGIIREQRDEVDIVLLDVMMPRMSGYDVCRRIRQEYSPGELPVIMLTAKNQVDNVIEGLSSGANDYITKPFSSEELLERINVHLQLLNANRELKQANEKLEEYNRTLEQKVAERTRDLREKNRLIIESMHFAQRIQNSILPLQEKMASELREHFVLYEPKDIVSGDFYWFEQVGDTIFIAVVDCTGHGVPGALMSMIGCTFLTKIVQEKGVHEPALILQALHHDLQGLLKTKGVSHIDSAGMDVALCKIEPAKNSKTCTQSLVFAGAHLPLYVIYFPGPDGANQLRGDVPLTRVDGDVEPSLVNARLMEIQGDRKPIGGLQQEKERMFTQKEIHLQGGEMIYMVTDGLADQNNKNDKKYGKRRVKQFLQEISSLPLKIQKEKLHEELSVFMGEEEQRDDITVVGFRM